jgi:hypothetical protein
MDHHIIMLKLRLTLAQVVIRLLCKVYLKLEYDEGLVRSWTSVVLRRAETRGTVETIGWIKSVRLACTRYLCASPLKDSPGFGVELDKEGLPKGIPPVELFRERDPSKIRLGLTLLGFSRLLPGWKAPDLEPVTRPFEGHISPRLREDLISTVADLGWKLSRPIWAECHASTKAGPNAQALVGSIEDAHLLTDEQISYLRVLGGDGIIQLIETIRSHLDPISWLGQLATKVRGKEVKLQPKGRSAKLSMVRDKEAKCRIVAILDYWTQSALYPLHLALMDLLRGLKPDCTFNQGSFRTTLPQQGPYYSFDLSQATDRFPVLLQELLLGLLISPEYAAAWSKLITCRDYHVTWGPRGTVRYACGQPMGAYSSWAMFSVCHHVIVRVAAKRAGKTVFFTSYALLGDDIVIADSDVAREYRTILSELDVSISDPKTHVSKDTYEFAKRWVHRGTEVTGAPLGSLFEAVRFRKGAKDGLVSKAISYASFWGVATWLREVEARWLPRTRTLVSRALLAELFVLLGQSAASRLAEKAWRFFLLPSREDSKGLQGLKRHLLSEILLGAILGCNHTSVSKQQMLGILLIECKARVLENAIKKSVQTLFRFQLEAKRFLSILPEGLDGQSILLALPPFAVLGSHIRKLQEVYEKVRVVRDSDVSAKWLHLEVRLVLDPFAAISTRQAKVVASNKATVLNHLSAMCRGIVAARALAITDIGLEDLVEYINTHEVVPTRGTPQKKRKGGAVSSKG